MCELFNPRGAFGGKKTQLGFLSLKILSRFGQSLFMTFPEHPLPRVVKRTNYLETGEILSSC